MTPYPTPLTRSEIRRLLVQYGITPSRALGQNFLCDQGVVGKIIRLAGVEPGDRVVEIGAGVGSLTVGLLRAQAEVLAVELDHHLARLLVDTLGPYGLTVHQGDALRFGWDQHLGQSRWKVVANLPYNISTPLVLDLLASQPQLERWLVMVQRESGERLVAGPGSRTYGIPSVLLAYWGEARIVGSVGADVFLPRPRVESVLVSIVRHQVPLQSAPYREVARVVKAGFGQRRKMLRRSLAPLLTSEQIEAADVDPTSRAEELDLDAWSRLALATGMGVADHQLP